MNGQLYLWRQPANRNKRVLIIVGDKPSDDPSLRLKGPPHDADAITAVLIEAGFEASQITRLDNPRLEQVRATLTTLAKDLEPHPDPQERIRGKSGMVWPRTPSYMQRAGLTAVSPKEPPANTLLLLFFTGHGVSIGGENYLMTHRLLLARIKDKAASPTPLPSRSNAMVQEV